MWAFRERWGLVSERLAGDGVVKGVTIGAAVVGVPPVGWSSSGPSPG